ncbi:single-stranded-DNA-specific exonuclease RecJ [Segnochrobactrum spirostomi]|uniref:Single-stranded-DNA-specific exonuclease RecJ n=1 Tax=Segnochrobactrum spirostomi TaxID=2608987 RepID=A0A6A7Y310_9HYPH|nr:single-stranded-DNA-specific exonuclease RecJ [Segnochrobactrum spirostomi]MQT12132.1 single-stranded-DNA-specific exonuclease RecJ [Segnochrobactrum spirostomi]
MNLPLASPVLATRSAPGARAPVLGVSASLGGRRWIGRLDERGAAEALAISQRHGVPDVIGRVLSGRSVGIEAVEAFLAPTLRDLMPDPTSLTDMEAAADRLADAVETEEQIGVVADYDVDGATSAAVLVRHLRALGSDAVVHVPDRSTEGYGVSVEAVERHARSGARLLVTLDCGTSSHEALEAARRLGLDTVVIDHHPAGVELPPARAIVNPNRQDDLSGCGHLCAAGVTFLVAVALNRTLRRRGFFATRREPDLLSLLDLVALGTVCDVVPLVGLNRAFVVKGLQVLKKRENLGLAALADAARMNGAPTPYHLGFLLGPRINAGGRIGDSTLGARLLVTEDPVEAGFIAGRLDALNRERQEAEALALAQAEAMLVDAPFESVSVVFDDGWHPGIVGLVAARLKERLGRPAFAIALDPEGRGTGSGRSISGVDLGAAVRAAAEAGLLIKGGGHAMAAGLTIARERIAEFGGFLEARLAADVAAARADDGLKLDGVLTAGGATTALVNLVERAGPYGAGHPEPIFAFPSHRLGDVRIVGQGHVKATLVSGDGRRLDGIAFRAADRDLGRALLAGRGESFHVAGCLGLDSLDPGRVSLRILDAADPRRTAF